MCNAKEYKETMLCTHIVSSSTYHFTVHNIIFMVVMYLVYK